MIRVQPPNKILPDPKSNSTILPPFGSPYQNNAIIFALGCPWHAWTTSGHISSDKSRVFIESRALFLCVHPKYVNIIIINVQNSCCFLSVHIFVFFMSSMSVDLGCLNQVKYGKMYSYPINPKTPILHIYLFSWQMREWVPVNLEILFFFLVWQRSRFLDVQSSSSQKSI